MTTITKPKDQLLVHIRRIRKGTISAHEGITIYAKRDTNNPENFWITFARCGKRDSFNKKIAKAIVEGRMECGKAIDHKFYATKEVLKNTLMYNDRKYSQGFYSTIFDKLLTRI